MMQLFFGNSVQSVSLDVCVEVTALSALNVEPFRSLQTRFGFNQVIVLRQMHKTDGLIIKEGQDFSAMQLRTYEGDFLVTNVKNVALGVLTADCLPLVFKDTQQEVVAIAHAGWRGSVQSIAEKTVAAMQKHFKTKVKNVEVFFGPCAKNCCYEVDVPFIEALKNDPIACNTLIKRGNKYYFDIPAYNAFKLEALQIPAHSLYFDANRCTMCCPEYCSYRTENGTQRRNISLVSLK